MSVVACRQGEKGVRGDAGEIGLKGEPGITGIPGAQGIQGQKGATGLQGMTGRMFSSNIYRQESVFAETFIHPAIKYALQISRSKVTAFLYRASIIES